MKEEIDGNPALAPRRSLRSAPAAAAAAADQATEAAATERAGVELSDATSVNDWMTTAGGGLIGNASALGYKWNTPEGTTYGNQDFSGNSILANPTDVASVG